LQSKMDIIATMQDTVFNIVAPLNAEISRLKSGRESIGEFSIDKLFEKMYKKDVIVRCGYCNTYNTITNPECIKCGAPGGNFIKEK